jgi:maltooligosyltrehalose synthase
VRARLAALSELPDLWELAVQRWSAINARYRVGDLPDRRTEWLLYQTLAGAHPISAERAGPYMLKAIREAKEHTSWTANDEANYLQDAWYDEFILRASLPAEPGELAFAVRQVCTQGEWNWAELPSAANPRPRAPAVRLKVTPARAEAHAH